MAIFCLKKNYGSLSHVLHNISYKFDIIALTENWLDTHDVNCFDIEGYQVIHTVRESKKGGGCSIYVNSAVKFNIVKNQCFTVDYGIECACVELDMGKVKVKVKVGVLRPVQQPGSYWNRSSELPLVGLEPTEVTAYD